MRCPACGGDPGTVSCGSKEHPNALDAMTDGQFLSYMETHSRTERALFNKEQLSRLATLAKAPLHWQTGAEWASLRPDYVDPLVADARRHLGYNMTMPELIAENEAILQSFEIQDQPMPVKNDSPPIQDLVIADIQERKRVGIERYGTLLQALNGRDALVDTYQEILDGAQYIRQEIEERRLFLDSVGALFYRAGYQLPQSRYNLLAELIPDMEIRLEDAKRAKHHRDILRRERDGEVWIWSTGLLEDGDNAETITCPILIDPETLWSYLSPVPMILPCPSCKTLHIDKPDSEVPDAYCKTIASGDCISNDPRCIHQINPKPRWTNPPHKTHLCRNCGAKWRPANVPTVGVPIDYITKGEDGNLCWEDFTNG